MSEIPVREIEKIIQGAIRRADRRWTATPMNPHEDGDIVQIEARKAAAEIAGRLRPKVL